MAILFGALAVIGALGFLAWMFSRMKTENAAQGLRVTLGVLGVILGGLLTIRGLGVAGVPLIGAALGLLGVALRGGKKSAGAAGSGRGRGRSASNTMTEAEARQVLNIGPDADEEAIRRAHREMMKKVHPDAGGSADLARRVQEARDVLLKKR